MRRTTIRLCSCCLAGAALLAGGCSQVSQLPAIPALTPYRMDVQQGNVVTQEMVEKLRPGMTPSQVRFILGTPLVVDAFHKDRWDYVYRFSKRGTLQESRRIVIVFQDDKLARIEGDVVPAKPGSTDAGVTIAPGAGKSGAAKPAMEKARPEPAAPQPAAATAGAEAPAGSASSAAGAAPDSAAASAQADKPREEKTEEGKAMP
jgi:outer membrane protein assembly factor BamE